eukprot:6212277-Pleurochrysis_carterae.AAC.2
MTHRPAQPISTLEIINSCAFKRGSGRARTVNASAASYSVETPWPSPSSLDARVSSCCSCVSSAMLRRPEFNARCVAAISSGCSCSRSLSRRGAALLGVGAVLLRRRVRIARQAADAERRRQRVLQCAFEGAGGAHAHRLPRDRYVRSRMQHAHRRRDPNGACHRVPAHACSRSRGRIVFTRVCIRLVFLRYAAAASRPVRRVGRARRLEQLDHVAAAENARALCDVAVDAQPPVAQRCVARALGRQQQREAVLPSPPAQPRSLACRGDHRHCFDTSFRRAQETAARRCSRHRRPLLALEIQVCATSSVDYGIAASANCISRSDSLLCERIRRALSWAQLNSVCELHRLCTVEPVPNASSIPSFDAASAVRRSVRTHLRMCRVCLGRVTQSLPPARRTRFRMLSVVEKRKRRRARQGATHTTCLQPEGQKRASPCVRSLVRWPDQSSSSRSTRR